MITKKIIKYSSEDVSRIMREHICKHCDEPGIWTPEAVDEYFEESSEVEEIEFIRINTDKLKQRIPKFIRRRVYIILLVIFIIILLLTACKPDCTQYDYIAKEWKTNSQEILSISNALSIESISQEEYDSLLKKYEIVNERQKQLLKSWQEANEEGCVTPSMEEKRLQSLYLSD